MFTTVNEAVKFLEKMGVDIEGLSEDAILDSAAVVWYFKAPKYDLGKETFTRNYIQKEHGNIEDWVVANKATPNWS